MRLSAMKNSLWFFASAAALVAGVALSASGQTLESYSQAMVRPQLEDQFGFDSPRWLRHRGDYQDGWGDAGYGPGDGFCPGGPRRPRGPGGSNIAPDLILYNCLGERRPLEIAVGRLKPFGTLKLIGA